MILIKEKNYYNESSCELEDDFEQLIIKNSKLFFGKQSVIINTKKKINTANLGGTIPDAFLFDFKDKDNPEFYLVEVELCKHDFYRHIFPQITKFFAFFKNSKSQAELIEKIFHIINNDAALSKEFKKHLGESEIYKSIKDIVENSQNILLVIDGEKKELPEIMDTYIETWGKLLKTMTIKIFEGQNSERIFYVDPEFENVDISMAASFEGDSAISPEITEEYHTSYSNENIREVYNKLKSQILKIDKDIIFNPQKFYMSLRKDKNFAYLNFKRKSLDIVLMLPIIKIEETIKNHPIKYLSESVKGYYNGDCASIKINKSNNLQEIVDALALAYEFNHSNGEY